MTYVQKSEYLIKNKIMKTFQGILFDYNSSDGCINYDYIPTQEEEDELQREEDEAMEE